MKSSFDASIVIERYDDGMYGATWDGLWFGKQFFLSSPTSYSSPEKAKEAMKAYIEKVLTEDSRIRVFGFPRSERVRIEVEW